MEVVVVDNASTDASCALIRDRYPAVELIQAGGNLGFPAGCNVGASKAVGELLVFLNPDTCVEPGWLAELVKAYDAHADHAGIVMSQIVLYDDPQRLNSRGNALHYLGFSWCPDYGGERDSSTEPYEVASASGASFLIPRRTFEEVGGFDGDLFMYHEDVDLCWRVRLAGYQIFCAPASVARHRYSYRMPTWKHAVMERNRLVVCFKNYSARTLLLLGPLALLVEMALWLQECLTGRALLRARIYTYLMGNAASLLRKRRRSQAQRRVGDREVWRWVSDDMAFEPFESKRIVVVFNGLARFYWRGVRLLTAT